MRVRSRMDLDKCFGAISLQLLSLKLEVKQKN